LRTFIAARIAHTPELRRVHSRLAELDDRLRPVSLDSLHLTLKFLGETLASQLSEIGSIVKHVAQGEPTIHVQLSGLGAFPHERRPSVVWAGFQRAEPLSQMAIDLDSRLASLGFSVEGREFQPHLTLLRIKSRPPEALFTLLAEEAETDFGIVEISHVELIESELTRSGARYTTLARFALAAS
jgi:RNA 2',3'-cyclic 3'-phosphodiesterase